MAEKSIRWIDSPCVLNCYRANARMSDRKAVIKNADMAEEMQQDAVDCATQALEKFNIEKVRNAFDKFILNFQFVVCIYVKEKSISKPYHTILCVLT